MTAAMLAEPIVLSRLEPFRVGAIAVRPATRELIGRAGTERVEPRVCRCWWRSRKHRAASSRAST